MADRPLLREPVAERRRQLILALAARPDQSSMDLLEKIYQTGYTGRIVLDCVDGVPKGYEIGLTHPLTS